MTAWQMTELPSLTPEAGSQTLLSKEEAKNVFSLKDKELVGKGTKVGARWKYTINELCCLTVPAYRAKDLNQVVVQRLVEIGNLHSDVKEFLFIFVHELYSSYKSAVDPAAAERLTETLENNYEQQRIEAMRNLAEAENNKRLLAMLKSKRGEKRGAEGVGGNINEKKVKAEREQQ